MELVPSISALIKEGPSIMLGHSENIAVDEPEVDTHQSLTLLVS